MDKESDAGLGTLSYLPLETRRKIYDLLLFDTYTKNTKCRTIRELYSSIDVFDKCRWHRWS